MIRGRSAALILLLLLLFPFVLRGQEEDDGSGDTTDSDPRRSALVLSARVSSDSVVLRWGTESPGGWIIGNQTGYVVERSRVSDEGALEEFVRLTPEPLRPWSLEEWKRRSRPEDRYAAIAAQLLYGDLKIPSSSGAEGEIRGLQLAADALTNRHGYALFAADMNGHAANGLALRFVDRDVRLGDRFIYRVLPAVQDETWWIDTAYDVVEIVEATPVPPPIGLEIEERDGAVRLTWRNPEGYSFTAFTVDRSEDGGRTFRELHSAPIVPITSRDVDGEQPPDYIDTTITNYRPYVWRVRGITHFGEMGQGEEIKGMGRDRTPPGRPVMKSPLLPAGNRVVLEWEVEGETSDLDGFVVARSRYPDQGFEQITPTPIGRGERSFVDTGGAPAHPYYMVGAVDTAGNVAPSLPVYVDLIDMRPPSVPTGLSGAIDSSGIVTLSWNLGPEEDLLGYRVLWANDSTHEFSQLTGEVLHDSIFVDTVDITTLTPVVYYRIAAVDTRYLHSPMTAPIELLRPDVIRPEPSVFTDVFVTDTSVVLRWAASRSSDVVRQVIYRRLADGGEWKQVTELSAEVSSWTDRDVTVRTRYAYRILTIDDAGLASEPAHDVNARPYDSGVRPGVDRLSGGYDEKKGVVKISWSFSKLGEKEWFVVYRSYNGSRMKEYRAVEGDEREFVDGLLVGSGTYTYGLRLMTPTGESPMSEELRVVVP